MAMSGKIAADFSEFVVEGDKAVNALRAVQGTGDTMARAVDRGLQTLAVGSGRTTNAFDTMRVGLSSVDRTLAQFGVNLTPQVAVLGELADVAGKTATQLGAMGTAGAVAAAALGGWQIGRWVAEVTGADAAIANLTASLLDLGNVAEETAAAKMDVVTRAIQHGADARITYNEAVKFNIEWEKAHAAALVTTGGRLKEWGDEIQQVADSGRLKQLKADIQANVLTLQELSDKYDISAGAIKNYEKNVTASHAVITKATEEAAARRKTQLEEEQKAHEQAVKAQEKIDRDYRTLQNQLGEEYLKLEGARLQKEVDDHAAAVAAKIAAEQEYFDTVLHGGLAIVGQPLAPGMGELERPQSLLTATPLNQRGVSIYTGPGAPAVDYGGYAGSPYMPRSTAGYTINTTVNAQNSFYTRPADVMNLADTISSVIGARQKSNGWSF